MLSTVLIADHDLESRSRDAATLRNWGYDVLEASTGTEALDIMRQPDAPGILLVTRELPGFSGLELCTRLRDSDLQSHVIVQTTRNTTDEVAEAFERGAGDCITRPFEPAELLSRLQVAAHILSLQQELHHTRERLENQTCQDSLTGLLSQGATMETLHREMSRARRQSDHSLCIALCTIDRFQDILDTHGEAAGERVLKAVAGQLKRELRLHDIIGRYGHEEFLMVLNIDAGQAPDLFERLCQQISHRPVMLGERSLDIRICIGAVVVPPEKLTENATALLDAADGALYEARSAGRCNTVVTV